MWMWVLSIFTWLEFAVARVLCRVQMAPSPESIQLGFGQSTRTIGEGPAVSFRFPKRLDGRPCPCCQGILNSLGLTRPKWLAGTSNTDNVAKNDPKAWVTARLPGFFCA